MSPGEDSSALGERLPPTDARFGMRSLLVIATAAALFAAGLGLLLRQFPQNIQTTLLLYWTALALVLIGCVAVVGHRRRDVEKQAGMQRFVLVRHSYLFPRMPRLSAFAVGAGCLILSLGYGIFLTVELANGQIRRTRSFLLQSLYAVSGCALGVSFLWWNRTISLCDAGVLVRHSLVPWSDNQRQYWDGCYRDVLVLEWQTHARIAVRVPGEEREKVEAFVRERIAEAKSAEKISVQQLPANA